MRKLALGLVLLCGCNTTPFSRNSAPVQGLRVNSVNPTPADVVAER